jgi:hypothetical protein
VSIKAPRAPPPTPSFLEPEMPPGCADFAAGARRHRRCLSPIQVSLGLPVLSPGSLFPPSSWHISSRRLFILYHSQITTPSPPGGHRRHTASSRALLSLEDAIADMDHALELAEISCTLSTPSLSLEATRTPPMTTSSAATYRNPSAACTESYVLS